MKLSNLFDSVVTNIKAVVGSNKDGVTLNRLNDDYEMMTGSKIPISELGYDSVEEFIRSLSDVFVVRYVSRQIRVFNIYANESETNLNLIKLIGETQPKKRFQPFRTLKDFNFPNPYRSNVFRSDYNMFTNPLRSASRNSSEVGNVFGFSSSGNRIIDKDARSTNTVACNGFNVCHRDADSRIVVISDNDTIDDDEVSATTCTVHVQTVPIEYKRFPRLYAAPSRREFVGMIADLMLEFMDMKLDTMKHFSICGDLHHYFTLMTGYTIDPQVFKVFLIDAVTSRQNYETYKSLVQIDEKSQNTCCLNLAPTCYTKINVPELEFDNQSDCFVEILNTIPNDNIICGRICNMDHIRRSRIRLPDSIRELMKIQPFWSWIPGSLCIVQMPSKLIKAKNISNIERAIIISTELATPAEVYYQKFPNSLLHKVSFYLIDHRTEICDILSYGVSLEHIKNNALNNYNVAFVSFPSFTAKTAPSKIQFFSLRNFKHMSHLFYDERLKTDFKIHINNIQKSECKLNFQPVYSCDLILNEQYEVNGRELESYNDVCERIEEQKQHDNSECQIVSETLVVNDKYNMVEEQVKEDKLSGFVSSEEEFAQTEVITISDDDDDDVVITAVEVTKPDILISQAVKSNATKFNTSRTSTPLPQVSAINKTIDEKKSEEVDTATREIITDLFNQLNIQSEEATNSEEINHVPISVLNNVRESNVDALSVISFTDDEKEKCVSDSVSDESLKPSNMDKTTTNETHSEMIAITHKFVENSPISVTIESIPSFHGQIVQVLHIKLGVAVVRLVDSLAHLKLLQKMKGLADIVLKKPEFINPKECYVWKCDDRIALIEVVEDISETSILAEFINSGIILKIEKNDVYVLPNSDKPGLKGSCQEYLGARIGAFNLHLIPDWFSMDQVDKLANTMFTAYFINETNLVLEFCDEPTHFLNIDMLANVERSLTLNHDNHLSRLFLKCLSEALVSCKLFAGELLLMISNGVMANEFSFPLVTDMLSKVTRQDRPDIWFASVDVLNENSDIYQKLSPNLLNGNCFCIDRVYLDKSKNKLVLLDHPDVYLDVPDCFDGFYKFDENAIRGSLRGLSEFYPRYMLAGATKITDLNFLYNKLIF